MKKEFPELVDKDRLLKKLKDTYGENAPVELLRQIDTEIENQIIEKLKQ